MGKCAALFSSCGAVVTPRGRDAVFDGSQVRECGQRSQRGLGAVPASVRRTLLQSEKVEVVGADVDDGEDHDRPGDGLVEGDVLVKRNEPVEERRPEQGDDIAAHSEQNDAAIEVEHGRTTAGLRGTPAGRLLRDPRPPRWSDRRGSLSLAVARPTGTYNRQAIAKDGANVGVVWVKLVLNVRREKEDGLDARPHQQKQNLCRVVVAWSFASFAGRAHTSVSAARP